MADIKFCCPHCNQHITCDELWGGHQLQCPSCQGTLTVPSKAPAGPPPAPVATAAHPPRPVAHVTQPASAAGLVPPPPPPSRPGLSIGAAKAQSAAESQQRVVPIRNLAAPPPKKSSAVLKILGSVGAVLLIGAACVFGFLWVRQIQSKQNQQNAAQDAKNSGESQVGHIANLNSVLDATEPGHSLGELSERRSSGPRQRPSGVGSEIPVDEAGADPSSPMAGDKSPVIAPTYTLSLDAAKIPDGRANGLISGSNFVAQVARIDPVSGAHVLRLMQGPLVSPDRELLVYLHLKPGEKLGGQSLSISPDMSGSAVPQVSKRWKTAPRSAPTMRSFRTGYAMKLQLGTFTNGFVPGKIYVALPDTEQTVVAGAFKASVIVPDPSQQAAPVATPAVNPAQNSADQMYRQRYGIKR